jgi:phage shock protein C
MTVSAETKRIYKSRTDRMVDGVCAGIAHYFGLDPTLVRIATVLLALLGGVGILLYIVAMIITPAAPAPGTESAAPKHVGNNERFWGVLLVVVGVVWLLGNLGMPIWHRWWGFSWDVLPPLLLILAGVAFLFGGRNYITGTSTTGSAGAGPGGGEPAPTKEATVEPKRLYRSRVERKVFGVCGGLGMYFRIDPTIVRLFFVASAFASFGMTAMIYVVMIILLPEEPIAAHTV